MGGRDLGLEAGECWAQSIGFELGINVLGFRVIRAGACMETIRTGQKTVLGFKTSSPLKFEV